MALIVEDGSIVAGADSYFTLEQAAEYAEKRGLTFAITGGNNQTLAEQAARRGTSFIDWKFRSRFPGTRKAGRSQPLEWPRSGAYDSEGYTIPDDNVPAELIAAAIEAAVREKAVPGGLSPDVTTGTIKKRVKVGDVEVEYAGRGDVASQRPIISVFTDILYPILTRSVSTGTHFTIADRI